MVLLCIFAFIFLQAGLGRVSPLLFGYAIDNSLKNPNIKLLTTLCFIYLSVELFKLITQFFISYLSEHSGNHVTYFLQQHIIRHIQRLPLSYFEKNNSGSIITKLIIDTNQVRNVFSESLQTLLACFIDLISIFIALTYISLPLASFTLILMILTCWITTFLNKRIKKKYLSSKKFLSRLNFFILESFKGINIFGSFNQLSNRRKKFLSLNGLVYREKIKLVKLFATFWPLFNIFNALSLGGSLILSYYFFKDWNLSLGEITAYILLLESLSLPLEKILDKYNHIQDSFSSAIRVQKVLEEKQEVRKGQKTFKKFKGKISFENVYFKYQNSPHWTLKDISFTINPGEKVSLIGKTGSGKTTIVNLLQKFYTPQKGLIKIDDIPLTELSTDLVRAHLGCIHQNTFLFKGSLLDNITLNNEKLKNLKKEIPKERLQLIEKLCLQTKPLHYEIGEDGKKLSLGEKQFLEILRFLIYNPKMMILDESVSHLDYERGNELKKLLWLQNSEKTILQIAHRIQSFEKFDQILLLDKGELIERGSHDELMRKKASYFQMIRQFPKLT